MLSFNNFKKVVIETLAKVGIKESDLYFTQGFSSHYAAYKPNHPGYTSMDFTVCVGMDNSVRICGNTCAPVPTIRPFMSLNDFKNRILEEKEIETLAAEINGSLNNCYQPDEHYIMLASDLYKAGYRKIKEEK